MVLKPMKFGVTFEEGEDDKIFVKFDLPKDLDQNRFMESKLFVVLEEVIEMFGLLDGIEKAMEKKAEENNL